MDTVLHDIRYAWRTLAKRPGFTTVAVLSLTYGAAVTAAGIVARRALQVDPMVALRNE